MDYDSEKIRKNITTIETEEFTKMKKVIVIGAGGHAKVVVDIIQQNKEYEVVGLIAQSKEDGFWNIPVIGTDEELAELFAKGIRYAFVAIGNGKIRKKITDLLNQIGFELINVISQHAIVSSTVRLGKGIVIMPGAIINADTVIEDGCIINTNASVDHDNHIGTFTHIAPGCAVAGFNKIGKSCFLGIGSRVIDRIEIGDCTTVGAGSVVIRNIVGNCTAVGVPARIIK